jgi:uncharacterized protein YcfL
MSARIGIGFLALVALAPLGCASGPRHGGNSLEGTTETRPADGPRIDQRIVIGSSSLDRKLAFGQVLTRQEGLLLHVQVSIENTTRKPVRFEYRWEWTDATGFQLGDTLSSWHPEIVDADAHKLLTGVGPGPGAVNFHLYLRDATS